MKKLIVVLTISLLSTIWSVSHAEVDMVGPGPAPVMIPEADTDVYFHIGALNLTIPWNNVNVVYLYDFRGQQSLMGGEAVIASLWRLQGTVGAVTSIEGKGAPFVGGNIWFDNPIPQVAILSQIKPGVFGGYDWVKGGAIFGIKAAFPIFD